jgi:hypothetical protein
VHGTVLSDGFLCGSWRLERDRDTGSATLVVTQLGRLSKRAIAAVGAEGRRFLRFAAAEAGGHDVRFEAPQ